MELNRWKCFPYWPECGSVVYGDIAVELLQYEEVHSFKLHTLCIHHVVSINTLMFVQETRFIYYWRLPLMP